MSTYGHCPSFLLLLQQMTANSVWLNTTQTDQLHNSAVFWWSEVRDGSWRVRVEMPTTHTPFRSSVHCPPVPASREAPSRLRWAHPGVLEQST